MATTHLCIVSERLIPNLIPALMLKPERVLLASSLEMEESGMTARLREVLASCGFRVEVQGALPSGGWSHISKYAELLAETLRRSAARDEIVLNLTGGNKLMAIAFSQALGRAVQRMIYTDTANGVLEELPGPGDRDGVSRALERVVNVPLYLAAQGMQLRASRSDASGWKEAVQER